LAILCGDHLALISAGDLEEAEAAVYEHTTALKSSTRLTLVPSPPLILPE
jgi:hypothetical protein